MIEYLFVNMSTDAFTSRINIEGVQFLHQLIYKLTKEDVLKLRTQQGDTTSSDQTNLKILKALVDLKPPTCFTKLSETLTQIGRSDLASEVQCQENYFNQLHLEEIQKLENKHKASDPIGCPTSEPSSEEPITSSSKEPTEDDNKESEAGPSNPLSYGGGYTGEVLSSSYNQGTPDGSDFAEGLYPPINPIEYGGLSSGYQDPATTSSSNIPTTYDQEKSDEMNEPSDTMGDYIGPTVHTSSMNSSSSVPMPPSEDQLSQMQAVLFHLLQGHHHNEPAAGPSAENPMLLQFAQFSALHQGGAVLFQSEACHATFVTSQAGPGTGPCSHATPVGPQHMQQQTPQPDEFYEKEGYQISIQNAIRFTERNDEAATAEMKSGTPFVIVIHNSNSYDADLNVTILKDVFDGADEFFVCWKTVLKNSTTVIERTELDEKELVFESDSLQDPGLEDWPKSIIKCVFKPDATSLSIRWPNGPEKMMAFPRQATIGDVFNALNCKLRKEGREGQVCGLIKADMELVGPSNQKLSIKKAGLNPKDKVVALTNKERICIKIGEEDPQIMQVDPLNMCIGDIQEFVISKPPNRDAQKDRIRIRIGNSIIDEMQGKKTLLSMFAETDQPVLEVEVAPEFAIQIKLDDNTEGESKMLKVHKFMKITTVYDILISNKLCSQDAKLYYKGDDITGLTETLEHLGIDEQDVLTVRSIPVQSGGRASLRGDFTSNRSTFRGGADTFRGSGSSDTYRGTRSGGTRSLGRIRFHGPDEHYRTYSDDEIDRFDQTFEESLKVEMIIKLHEYKEDQGTDSD